MKKYTSTNISHFRDGPRRPLRWEASLGEGDNRHPCTILNLSLGGAKIQLETALEPGTIVRLEIPDLCVLEGQASWYRYGCLGIQFSTSPRQVLSLLGDKARALDLEGRTGRGGDR